MNENQKNIETCLPEDILAEVAGVPQDAHFRSLVEEAFDPLQQSAATQAGWDDYESHQPYTFTSSVRQMKSNLLLLLRRLWRYPFGCGTLRSLADMWSHYITRLQGNAEYGIPSRLSQLTDLPSAPLLLSDRKISEPNAIDGISLAQLLGSSDAAATLTEITDTNHGWTLDKAWPHDLFPNVETMTVGVGRIEEMRTNVFTSSALKHLYLPDLKYFSNVTTKSEQAAGSLMRGTDVETITIQEIEEIHTDVNNGSFIRSNVLKEVYMESLTDIRCSQNSWTYRPYSYASPLFRGCPALEKVVTNIEKVADNGSFVHSSVQAFRGSHNLRYFKFGTLKSWDAGFFYQTDGQMLDFIHLEIGADTAISLNFQYWSPTNALDASRTDLIEEGSTAANNLEQFLSNFKTYIAERLADNGAGLTLTLSQAVFSAIWDANGDPLPTHICQQIHKIIKTDKHWDVNKA